ncbi:kinesin-like protein KIF25 [Lingula anatina]|uniref:Kinesin-like protein KIF25 n=1 Tax=Lingula anatina TaxID=7574 RepID=A0A1S3JT32_LINAN|nr:kinesin-like protein KIF25 [Lingula anatina]|eukprot:XP_013413540.1 kinesin-like protein KIF25 [Lingula anatina]
MPIEMDQTHFLTDKLKTLECQSRGKEERIIALETENAMLYLKLAQLQGILRDSREETGHLKRVNESDQLQRQRTGESLATLSGQVKALRDEMKQLRLDAVALPHQFQVEYDNAMSQARLQTQKMRLNYSNVSDMEKKMVDMEAALQEANARHAKEKKRRRELHNTLMELRGNIRVHCRIRPLMEFDVGNQDVSTLGRPGSLSEVVTHVMDDENVVVKTSKHSKVYEFERVYSPQESQEAVFEEVQPMLTSLLDGYNVCIMAYGQTGSGKTHTMLGSHKDEDYHVTTEPHPDEGIIPRATRELLRLMEEKPPDTHSAEVSVVEIYNNDILDLLSSDPRAKHDLVTNTDGSMCVPTVTSRPVKTVYEVMSLVQHGLKARREIATLVHEHSSRSHLVVTLTVSIKPNMFLFPPATPGSPTEGVFAVPLSPAPRDKPPRRQLPPQPQGYTGAKQTIRSRSPSPVLLAQTPTGSTVKTKLQLVDLAGSECVGMSGVTGQALRETSHINKSLCALADVLGALAEHRAHVPYRNSKITHLLQDSIGGDAKLLAMLCVSPAQRYVTESLQCLGFGQRARQVQRGPIKRKLPPSLERVGPGDSSYSGRNSPRPKSAGPLRT